jgi:hypothetical protein
MHTIPRLWHASMHCALCMSIKCTESSIHHSVHDTSIQMHLRFHRQYSSISIYMWVHLQLVHPVNPVPPHCPYLATVQPPEPPLPAVGEGWPVVVLTDVAKVLESPLTTEVDGCVGVITEVVALPATASVPPAITSGPGAT